MKPKQTFNILNRDLFLNIFSKAWIKIIFFIILNPTVSIFWVQFSASTAEIPYTSGTQDHETPIF